jgi:hypothetical protein
MITHVAIRYNDKVYSLPAPNRHHHVILLIAEELGIETVIASGDDQGFLDENGLYYRRGAALMHALEHEQVKDLKCISVKRSKLFSDDIW